ncbi:protein spaetzle-like [Zeugodacus cucurbitae]|uniref:protein spaetzle-like n=1 Tax=Zeugodacus cucurbitae TaxID=28588 RepID=UPI0023D949D2|nr:protein spaetzle-like [Zeugodacus cucurbitae]
MSSKLSLVFTTLALFLILHKTNGRPSPMPSADVPKDILNKLKSVFRVGHGIMVYNTGVASEELEDDEIVCTERRAGKTYCKEVENYIEATRLDKIDPEQFAKFQEYFKDDLVQTQMVATRMDVGDSKTKVIYPEGALSEDSKWLLVVQHGQHKQGVLVEECENVDRTSEENSTLPVEYVSTCKQNFTYRKLVVLVNGEMKEEMVKLPSNCECSSS